jgi:hypothetical protein
MSVDSPAAWAAAAGRTRGGIEAPFADEAAEAAAAGALRWEEGVQGGRNDAAG